MTATVDGVIVPRDILWWPAMNYNQFRWEGQIGHYELRFLRTEFVERLSGIYSQMVIELRADDVAVPDNDSHLTQVNYPPLAELPDFPAAFLEALSVYLWDDLFTAFLPHQRAAGPTFMVNSIESCAATEDGITVRGRGYHRPAL